MSLPNLSFFVFLIHLLNLHNLVYSSECPNSFECGNLGHLEFPFSNIQPNCGLFMVNCTKPIFPSVRFQFGGNSLDILPTNSILVRNSSLEFQLNRSDCSSISNLFLPNSPSTTFKIISPNLINLHVCSNEILITDYYQNYSSSSCGSSNVYYRNPSSNSSVIEAIPQDCSMIQMPLKSEFMRIASEFPVEWNISHYCSEYDTDPWCSTTVMEDHLLYEILSSEFTIEWNISQNCIDCHNKGGQCATQNMYGNMNQFLCSSAESRNRRALSLFAISLGGGLSMIVISIISFVCFRRKYKLWLKIFRGQNDTMKEKDIKLFLERRGNLAQKIYKYSDVKKMTYSFRDKLGNGGYGDVYKGKLPDGRLVAVKFLKELKGNGEDFINEVDSISRTSHVNIVSLFGLCFEGSKRALIYEFMPNGSLEKFISSSTNSSSSIKVRLGLEKLYDIAVGIARGLEYLHRGCSTRIVHFDIKPHNILIDNDLTPKISDFGLAKLCPNRASILSMLGARGTIGYIAPEVFSRNFGEVSHKSDVYSYGMMILEMAVGKQDTNSRAANCSSEMYFPESIYRHLQLNNENGDNSSILNEDESRISRKMIIVGLWCIQTDPKKRPSVSRVLEMLEANVKLLEIPPKPYLSSPPRTFSKASSYNFSIL